MIRAIAVATLCSIACAHAPARTEVVWPAPPDKARVRFVTSFRHTDDLDGGGWSQFRRAVSGVSESSLRQPMGLALSADGKRLYIADPALNRIFVADFARKSLQGVSDMAPNQPFGIAVDDEENLYVSETGARRVGVYDRKGQRKRTLTGFDRPLGLALDRQRRILYAVDGGGRTSEKHRVLAYGLDGAFLFELGPKEGKPGRGTGDGQFYYPAYVAVDAAHNVWVGDTMNFRVQVFGPDGKFLRKFGEHGDGAGNIGRVKGLAFDSFGNLYEVDSDHGVVQIFNPRFEPLLAFGGREPMVEYFDVPSCIAIDPAINRIYVCNTKMARINAYDLINTSAEELAKGE